MAAKAEAKAQKWSLGGETTEKHRDAVDPHP